MGYRGCQSDSLAGRDVIERSGGLSRNRTPTALIPYDPAGAGVWLRDAPYSTVTVLAKLRG